MKAVNAIIGGEGNGGVILPELHYGRDALVGTALFLSFLAKQNISVSELKKNYSNYVMAKQKIELSQDWDADALLAHLTKSFVNERITTIDGVKIDFEDSWIHLRKSNTEPIIRLYAEAADENRIHQQVEKIESAIAAFVASI